MGFDDQAYRRMVDYDGNYNDVYLVDAVERRAQAGPKKLRGGAAGGPPAGRPTGSGPPTIRTGAGTCLTRALGT